MRIFRSFLATVQRTLRADFLRHVAKRAPPDQNGRHIRLLLGRRGRSVIHTKGFFEHLFHQPTYGLMARSDGQLRNTAAPIFVASALALEVHTILQGALEFCKVPGSQNRLTARFIQRLL